MLTLLSAQAFNYQGSYHVDLAASIEFIHTATLLHDDVVDGSSLRRGKPTANDVWGNKASILVGDFLLSQAFELMVGTGSLSVLDILSRTSAIIAEGEVLQLSNERNIHITQETYIQIITGGNCVTISVITLYSSYNLLPQFSQYHKKPSSSVSLIFSITSFFMSCCTSATNPT